MTIDLKIKRRIRAKNTENRVSEQNAMIAENIREIVYVIGEEG